MGNEEKLLQQKMSEDMSEEDKQMLEWLKTASPEEVCAQMYSTEKEFFGGVLE